MLAARLAARWTGGEAGTPSMPGAQARASETPPWAWELVSTLGNKAAEGEGVGSPAESWELP